MLGFKKFKWPDALVADVDGQSVSVRVRVHARAKNYRLTIGSNGQPAMTVPPYGRLHEAEGFLLRQQNWLAARLNRLPAQPRFCDGARMPLRGEDHLIVASGKIRGTVERLEEAQGPILLVPGAPEHMARRLKDWLKQQALDDLQPAVARHAGNLDVHPASIRIRGQSSRWGSCSSAGRLNFNWRLVLTPDFVLDYVAAHEVAHLVEMNHSAAFWQVVAQTLPDMERGRAWLRAHGREIMAYGADD